VQVSLLMVAVIVVVVWMVAKSDCGCHQPSAAAADLVSGGITINSSGLGFAVPGSGMIG
jgi:hypothetical protein